MLQLKDLSVWSAVLLLWAFNVSAGQTNKLMENLTKNEAGFSRISAGYLVELLDNKDFIMINVHVPYNGHIPGTDYNIDFRNLQAISMVISDKSQPFVIYCRSGNMSSQAATQLAKQGYTNVVELSGGYKAWKAIDQHLDFQ